MSVKIDKGSALSSLSMTPLIDVIFLLLIFFLVATKFAEEERELEVRLPSASEAMPLSKQPKELFININEHGEYYVTGQLLTLRELDAALQRADDDNPGRVPVVIRADERCVWQSVVAAMNACKKAGIHDFRTTTRPSSLPSMP